MLCRKRSALSRITVATRVGVVTNSSFTPSAKALAEEIAKRARQASHIRGTQFLSKT